MLAFNLFMQLYEHKENNEFNEYKIYIENIRF